MLAAGLCLWLPTLARGEWSDLRVSQRSAAAALYLLLAGSIVGFTATRTP